ncbi:competence protein ComEA [Mycoplasmopsis caviae]|uniref:Competence protein ComEA n=1 Tax=Mycoplasmopsis caviae TaxID=55603 RepID=A0A3P8MF63_9BACT|nr:competence protein ComEA [Mycoplasmopsis caviae]UUD35501.1 competence protein ComEA [Mycoplasmopsis caviae]VDR41723.1 Uncharacterised protein [Mycoplasmopsis caviae]
MKYKKMILGTILAGTIVISTSTIAFNIQKTKVAKIDDSEHKNEAKFSIKLSGAVVFAKSYYFDKPLTLRQLLNIAKVYENADLSNFNLRQEIKENLNIYIPYKKSNLPFLKWSNLNNDHLKLLMDFEIKKSIAVKILNLRHEKNNITWNDLKNISGIGKLTLEKLKTILIL